MHPEILTSQQTQLLPLVESFYKHFCLVGGTAIALQIGHRRSIDFDLFSFKEFRNSGIRKEITRRGWKIEKVFKDEDGQFTFIVNGVQLTFFQYPFKISSAENFGKKIRMPNLLTLAAMKAYALGRRAKWKAYVDLYFVIHKYHTIQKIIQVGKKIFKDEFNERIFREQLAFFDDINYDEQIEWLPGFPISNEKIKRALIQYSLV